MQGYRLLASLFLIGAGQAFPQNGDLAIPPLRTSIDVAGHPIAITTVGTVSGNRQSTRVRLSVDLADFQDHITDLLHAELDRNDRCGERISVLHAEMQPFAPGGAALNASVHFEKWACVKALGKQINKRLLGGDALVPVKLTPVVTDGRELNLAAEVGQIQADGSLGEVLHSNSFGPAVQEKVRIAILKALNKSAALHAALPPKLAEIAQLRRASFHDAGGGRLAFDVEGEIALPFEQVRALVDRRQ